MRFQKNLPIKGQRRKANEFENDAKRYEQSIVDGCVNGNAEFAKRMIVVEKVERFFGGEPIESWCAQRFGYPDGDLMRSRIKIVDEMILHQFEIKRKLPFSSQAGRL